MVQPQRAAPVQPALGLARVLQEQADVSAIYIPAIRALDTLLRAVTLKKKRELYFLLGETKTALLSEKTPSFLFLVFMPTAPDC